MYNDWVILAGVIGIVIVMLSWAHAYAAVRIAQSEAVKAVVEQQTEQARLQVNGQLEALREQAIREAARRELE